MYRILVFSTLMIAAQLAMALNPSRTYKQRPDKYNMQYEEIQINTEDGFSINTWIFPARNSSDRTIILSHNGEGNMADYLRRVDQFLGLGFKVVSYDYRGYGESSEFEIDNEYYLYSEFVQDFQAVVKQFKAESNALFLYGWGIGATLSLGAGFSMDGIQGIIADTPIGSMENLQNKSLKIDPNFSADYNPQKALEKKPGADLEGVFLILGSNETLVQLEDLSKFRKQQKKLIKDIHVVANPDQKDNFRVDKAAYMAAIQSFLDD